MISAELWSATSLVFQSLPMSNKAFGGVLIACGDFLQLPPPSGTPILRSFTIRTSCNFFSLQHFVRMEDRVGQNLLQELSLPTPNAEIVGKIISAACNFIEDFEHVPDSTVMVVFKRKSEKERVKATIEEI